MSKVGEALDNWQRQSTSVMRQDEPLALITEEDGIEPKLLEYPEEITVASNPGGIPSGFTEGQIIVIRSAAIYGWRAYATVKRDDPEHNQVWVEEMRVAVKYEDIEGPERDNPGKPETPMIPDVVNIGVIELKPGIQFCYAAWGIRLSEKTVANVALRRKSDAEAYMEQHFRPDFKMAEVVAVKKCLLQQESGAITEWIEILVED